ncbi:MAG: amidase [Cellulomonas sp.]|uniref:amidase n=1 Tax=Cellulomonas sp. TaxID=40001 RepID=UPI001A098504|nr:amidase [Cellulomonas sp.]MBF0688394.1 amidase [Cellulomonas sp.]
MTATAAAAAGTATAAPATLTEAAAAVRDGDLTAGELVESAIAAADRHDTALGVYMSRFDDQARAAAAAADDLRASGAPVPPMLGVPLGIKDIIVTTEGPTTGQSLVHDTTWQAGTDAVVVQRLRAAGGIMTGKTTTMEFATGVPDLTKPLPVPRNPWHADHWTGGSSSGTGNGVVVGAFLGGLGTDTGGSIRLPAAYCGISGLKATYGRVPKSGCIPLGYSLDHIGPMARSAADCALMLEALAGHDPSDLTSATAPVSPYTAALTGDLTGLRIGVDTLHRVMPDRDPEVDRLLQDALAALEELGATLVPIELPLWDEVMAAMRITSRSEALAYHLPDLRARWSDYFDSTRQGVASGAFVTGADYVQAQRLRQHVRGLVADLFRDVDVVVTPTTSTPAPRIDELAGGRWNFRSTHTGYWNAVGNPALAAPMGFLGGLPMSVQVVGRPFDEATVLRVGDAYQRVTAWHLATLPD